MASNKFFTYRVTPTIHTGDLDTGETLFNLTKILTGVRGGKSVKLKYVTAIDVDKTSGDIGLHFFQKNTTANIGTLGAASNISDANFLANIPIGMFHLRWNNTAGVLANVNQTTYNGEVILTSHPDATEGEIYVAGIAAEDDIDFAAADDLDLIFHFEIM